MNAFDVIMSGIAVFIMGEIVVRFFLAPLHRLKEVKGDIASTLLFHANNYGQIYQNVDVALDGVGGDERFLDERVASVKKWNNDLDKASDETRAAAAKLISAAEGIPFYTVLSAICVVPSKKDIIKARSHLTGLSNSFAPNQAVVAGEKSDSVCKLLNIKFMAD